MGYNKLVRCKTRYSDLISDEEGNIQEKENWVEMQFSKDDLDIVTYALDMKGDVADKHTMCTIYLGKHGSFVVDIPFNDALIYQSEKYKVSKSIVEV